MFIKYVSVGALEPLVFWRKWKTYREDELCMVVVVTTMMMMMMWWW
jgi:hypothetical protein